MPLCFRCGKSMSTEQALYYHLSKVTPCDYSCKFCKKTFRSKTEYLNHTVECSVHFALDNILDIIGVLDDTKCTYLLDENNFTVQLCTVSSNIRIGESFLNNVLPDYIEDLFYKLETTCELSTNICTIKRNNLKSYNYKMNIINYIGNSYLLVREY